MKVYFLGVLLGKGWFRLCGVLWCRVRSGLDGAWSDFTRVTEVGKENTGTFPYYSAGVIGEAFKAGDYKVSNGRYYSQGTARVWYPAPGLRDRATGALTYVGSEGSVWSATASGTNGVYLGFNATGLDPSNAAYRANGLPVRCLQE